MKKLFESDTEFTVRKLGLLPDIEMSYPVKLVPLTAKVSRSIQSRELEVPTGTVAFMGPL